MREINLNRQLLGLEDLEFGTGTVEQIRAGTKVNITKINAGNLPFDETRTLFEFTQAVNIEELGNSIEAINNINNNLDKLLIVEDNLPIINNVEAIKESIVTLDTNILALQNIETNMSSIHTVEDNLPAVNSVAQNIVPNLTKILNVDTLADQVTQDKDSVSSMKLTVETIYDTFDARFSVIDTVDEFGTVPSGIDTVIVKDLNRGGTFIYDATKSDVNNGGTVFNGWVRQYSGAVNVKWFGAKGDGITNDTVAIQSAINLLNLSGGIIHIPNGEYVIVKSTSPDSIGYGLRISHNGYEGTPHLTITGSGTLLANDDSMALLRISAINVIIDGIKFDGANKVSTYGILCSSTNRAADVFLDSWSLVTIRSCLFSNLAEGVYLETPRTIGLAQGGAFYPIITGCNFNDTTRGIRLTTAPNDAGNRPTRGLISGNKFSRGNVGIDITAASEFTLLSNNFEFINVGTLPRTTPTAVVFDVAAYNIEILGGYTENCTWSFDNLGDASNHNRISNTSWDLTASNRRDFMAGWSSQGFRLVGEAKSIQAENPSFAAIKFETSPGRKNIIVNTNNTDNMEWFNGTTRHIGTTGSITFSANGTDISGSNSVALSATTFARIRGQNGLYLGGGNSDDQVILLPTTLRPVTDNVVSLGGDSGSRWSVLYAGTGSINTSDAREKTFSDIPEVEMQVAKELKSLVRRFKFNDAIELKGENKARIHYGTSAQEVIAAFTKYNLDAMEYGMVCYDEWEENLEVKDEEGNIIQPYRPAGSRYGIRYEELLCFIISAL